MDERALIIQAVDQYWDIDRLSAAIEDAVHHMNIRTLTALSIRLDQMQEETKTNDSAVLDLLRRRTDLRGCAETEELLALMQRIETRNRQMVPHINSIMAVQRSELHTVQRGNCLLQRYRSESLPTGKRLSSSG